KPKPPPKDDQRNRERPSRQQLLPRQPRPTSRGRRAYRILLAHQRRYRPSGFEWALHWRRLSRSLREGSIREPSYARIDFKTCHGRYASLWRMRRTHVPDQVDSRRRRSRAQDCRPFGCEDIRGKKIDTQLHTRKVNATKYSDPRWEHCERT